MGLAPVLMFGDSLAKANDIFEVQFFFCFVLFVYLFVGFIGVALVQRVQFLRAEDGGCRTRVHSHTVGTRVDAGGLPQRLSWNRRWP